MPSKAIRQQLVPDSFHQDLVRDVTAAGFTRMFYFRATTERDKYHVPARYAQETIHFFNWPGYGFLIRLEFSEHIDDGGRYSSWWTGGIYLGLNTKAMVEYEVQQVCSKHEGPQYFMDGCEPLKHIMSDLAKLVVPFELRGSGWTEVGDSYYWELNSYPDSEQLTAEQLVEFISNLAIYFRPFLRPMLAHRFDASRFVSIYSWPDIRERFWRSFPLRLLREMVSGRISGREEVKYRRR